MIDGIIYKLFSKDADEFYVGSTTNFHNRKNSHKSNCNNEKDKEYNSKKYQYIRDNSGFENWEFEILELGEYQDKYCMKDRERYFIETLKPSLNSDIPNRTDKEYYQDNQEKINEIHREYYKNNKEKLNEKKKEFYENNKEKFIQYREDNREKAKEYSKKYYGDKKEKINEIKRKVKIECEFCGSIVRKSDIAKHQKTNKCLSQRTDIALTTT